MTELIEKTSYEATDKKIRSIVSPYFEEDPYNYMNNLAPKLQEYIAEQVELAYKAGMLQFNAFDHTLKTPWENTVWTKANLNFMDTGDYVLLPSLYLQAKGFKK